MTRFDRCLILFLLLGIWGLLGYYITLSRPAESQDFYFDVQQAVNNCAIFGKVQQDFYGAHRLQAAIDCGPSWVQD